MYSVACPTWIAPVFLPHLGCEHRCVFCNQNLVARSPSPPTPEQVRARLERYFLARRHDAGKRRQIAFYGGSFTGMKPSLQREYLTVACNWLDRGLIDSIRVSARPDELSPERLAFLAEQGVATVEIGVQSLSNKVLESSRRGHTARVALDSIREAKRIGLEVGAQVMVGLPGDSGTGCMETARLLCRLRPHFVRIYALLVFRKTELAERMQKGRYRPLDLDRAVSLSARMLERFEKASIPVIRIGLQNEEGMEGPQGSVLAGPFHPAFGFLVRSRVFFQRVLRVLPESLSPGASVCVWIHPHDRPLLSGYRRENIRRIRGLLGKGEVRVVEDGNFPRGEVACQRT